MRRILCHAQKTGSSSVDSQMLAAAKPYLAREIDQLELNAEAAEGQNTTGYSEELVPDRVNQLVFMNASQFGDEDSTCSSDDNALQTQLELLLKTDFGDAIFGTKVNPSVQDKKAFTKIEQ